MLYCASSCYQPSVNFCCRLLYTFQQDSAPCERPSSCIVARRRTSSQLACDLPNSPDLNPACGLQNLDSATGVGLSVACAWWWVEATSHWQLVKHPACDHLSSDRSVVVRLSGMHLGERDILDICCNVLILHCVRVFRYDVSFKRLRR